MISEVEALLTAKLLLEQYGAQEAWHMLMSRAVKENDAGLIEARGTTLQVLAALDKLTVKPDGKLRH